MWSLNKLLADITLASTPMPLQRSRPLMSVQVSCLCYARYKPLPPDISWFNHWSKTRRGVRFSCPKYFPCLYRNSALQMHMRRPHTSEHFHAFHARLPRAEFHHPTERAPCKPVRARTMQWEGTEGVLPLKITQFKIMTTTTTDSFPLKTKRKKLYRLNVSFFLKPTSIKRNNFRDTVHWAWATQWLM